MEGALHRHRNYKVPQTTCDGTMAWESVFEVGKWEIGERERDSAVPQSSLGF